MEPLLALTGGTGFIGRRFANAARTQGYRIRHLARNPGSVDPADELRLLDLRQGLIDADALTGCDAVVHLAAHIPRDHADPAEAEHCWQTNALGTLRLAEAAVRAGVSRFVHTTSANAYAAWEKAPAETAAMFPRSRGYYLGSKIMQEIYAEEFCRHARLPLATMRLGSVYGPGQTTGVVAALASAIANHRPVTLQNGGSFGADFVHVDDVVEALMLAIGKRAEGPFNVGSGVRTTIGRLARMLIALTGQDAALLKLEAESDTGDTGFPALSIKRLRKLGYVPRKLSTGLTSLAESSRSSAYPPKGQQLPVWSTPQKS